MRGSPFLALLAVLGFLAPFARAEPYDRLYVFGDSYSDTGAGYVDGNGPTAVAYLAWQMGLSLAPPQAPGAAQKSINFAVSGAGSGEGEGQRVKGVLLGYGMRNQVRDFVARVRTGEIRFEGRRTLFFLAGGLNDGAVSSAATLGNLRAEVVELRGAGGRHFTVALLPEHIPHFAAVGRRLNAAYQGWARDAGRELAVDLWLNHWGPDFDKVRDHPREFGLANTTDACAGRALFDEDATPVGDPTTFYYYHEGHPSTAVHRSVGLMLYAELAQHPAVPAGD